MLCQSCKSSSILKANQFQGKKQSLDRSFFKLIQKQQQQMKGSSLRLLIYSSQKVILVKNRNYQRMLFELLFDSFYNFKTIGKTSKKSNGQIQQDKYSCKNIFQTQKRMSLVKLVLDENYSIMKAGKKLSIKLSTAKQIISRFQKKGTFFEKKENKKMEQTPEMSRVENNSRISQHSNEQRLILPIQNENQNQNVNFMDNYSIFTPSYPKYYPEYAFGNFEAYLTAVPFYTFNTNILQSFPTQP